MVFVLKKRISSLALINSKKTTKFLTLENDFDPVNSE